MPPARSSSAPPAGAGIYLDNKYRGVTPVVLADIPAGSHTFVLRQNGYAEWTSAVTVNGGSYTEISGKLVPATVPMNPATANPLPQLTKSGLSVILPFAGIAICGALVLLQMKE